MRRNHRSQQGMTLVELVIGTALLVGGGGALLLGMNYALMHSDYLNDYQIALNAAQSRLEEISSQNFSTLMDASGPYGAALNSANSMCLTLDETDEDRDCDGVLDAGEDTYLANGRLDTPINNGHLWLRLTSFPPGSTDPTVLTIRITSCWPTSRGRRIGEDVNCNGVLNGAEDTNGNGLLDSPVLMTTQIADND